MRALFAEYLVWKTPFRVGSHYYAGHFLEQGWDVGWIGGEFHLFNLVNNRAELVRKGPIWRQGGAKNADGVWEYSALKLLPYRRMAGLENEHFAWSGDRWTWPRLSRVLARHRYATGDLLWLSNLHAYSWLARRDRFRVIVYRAADDHAAFAESPASLSAVEQEVVERSHVVFAVSHAVYERLRRIGESNVIHLPNGVNLKRFAQIAPPPPEYLPLRKPIAVYVGSIHYWFDVELLAAVAEQRQDMSFVLIGQANTSLARLSGLSNVYFLGTRMPEQLSGYLQHADVGLIPFVRSRMTESINPLKMYEYLACGLPVVSTDLAEIRAMAAPVYLASDAPAYLDALDAALAASDEEKDQFRRYAAQHTWEARYAQVDAALAPLFVA
jgi:glycosyltransferase involved in cell wall biosynthesis